MWLLNNESYQISTTGFAGTTESQDHYEKNKFEKEYVLNKIRTLFGKPPSGSYMKWKGYEHDFGMYYEATIFWNSNNEKLDEKVWDFIGKIEEYNWDLEDARIAELWDIRDIEQLEKENEIINLIYLQL